MWFIAVEVEQETSAPPPNKNPGSAPAHWLLRGHMTFNNENASRQCFPWNQSLSVKENLQE